MNADALISTAMEDRAAALVELMREVTGIDPVQTTRRRPVHVARMIVAERLLAEGWTEEQAARIFGINRTTINYYRHKVATMLHAPGYGLEREIYQQFNNAL